MCSLIRLQLECAFPMSLKATGMSAFFCNKKGGGGIQNLTVDKISFRECDYLRKNEFYVTSI